MSCPGLGREYSTSSCRAKHCRCEDHEVAKEASQGDVCCEQGITTAANCWWLAGPSNLGQVRLCRDVTAGTAAGEGSEADDNNSDACCFLRSPSLYVYGVRSPEQLGYSIIEPRWDIACDWCAKGGYSSAFTLEALENQVGNSVLAWPGQYTEGVQCRYEVRWRVQPPNFSRVRLESNV